MRALGRGSVGPRLLAQEAFDVAWGSEGPARSLALNDRRHSDGPRWWPGGRVSLALGLGGPPSPGLRRQAPWEGPLGG